MLAIALPLILVLSVTHARRKHGVILCCGSFDECRDTVAYLSDISSLTLDGIWIWIRDLPLFQFIRHLVMSWWSNSNGSGDWLLSLFLEYRVVHVSVIILNLTNIGNCICWREESFYVGLPFNIAINELLYRGGVKLVLFVSFGSIISASEEPGEMFRCKWNDTSTDQRYTDAAPCLPCTAIVLR